MRGKKARAIRKQSSVKHVRLATPNPDHVPQPYVLVPRDTEVTETEAESSSEVPFFGEQES